MLELANALVLMLLGAMLFFPRLWLRSYLLHCLRRKPGVFTFDVSPLLRLHDCSESHCRLVALGRQ